MREKENQTVEMRTAVAVAMARLNIIQDVPVYLTGAQWRALSADLNNGLHIDLGQFCAYVQAVVNADLAKRGIEAEPLCVREANAARKAGAA
jgi:hypothetical protein